MEWNRSETLGLSSSSCPTCKGKGLILNDEGQPDACKCVLRAIFRVCCRRFEECAVSSLEGSRCSPENSAIRELPGSFSRKNEEYVADFLLIAKRTLSAAEYQLFRFRYVLGADWRLCSRRLNLDKGKFHYVLYNIQQKLGRVFRELEPYALFPLDDYFSPGMRVRPAGTVTALRPSSKPSGKMGSVPLGRAA